MKQVHPFVRKSRLENKREADIRPITIRLNPDRKQKEKQTQFSVRLNGIEKHLHLARTVRAAVHSTHSIKFAQQTWRNPFYFQGMLKKALKSKAIMDLKSACLFHKQNI